MLPLRNRFVFLLKPPAWRLAGAEALRREPFLGRMGNVVDCAELSQVR